MKADTKRVAAVAAIPDVTQGIIRRLELAHRDIERIEDRAESFKATAARLEADCAINKAAAIKLEREAQRMQVDADAQLAVVQKIRTGLQAVQDDVMGLIGAHIDIPYSRAEGTPPPKKR